DWVGLDRTLGTLLAGRPAQIPCYDFKTHSCLPQTKVLHPKAIILVDGLWLLWRPVLRPLFTLSVFLDCPTRTRLSRRLARDCRARGRTGESVKEQFRATVEPMHLKYV